jgi:opacity protein-like surface antigen
MAFIDPPTVDAETKVVPSVTVSERYDSNVWFAPQSLVPDQKLWDVVTFVAPEVKVQHRGQSIEGDLKVGGSGNAYINNPGLNFFSVNASLDFTLDKWIRRLIGRTHLQVENSFMYTPQPPVFLTPQAAGPVNTTLIGIQTFRANSLLNVARARWAYDISPTLSVRGNYQNSIYSFGQIFVAAGPGAFNNTITEAASAGPEIKLSPRDTANLIYEYSTTQFGEAAGFKTHTIMAEYTRIPTPAFMATVNVGGTQIEPGGSRNVVGKAELNWRLSEDERWTISYTREISVAFFIVAAPLVSERFSASRVHQFTERLATTASANYALNESISTPVVRFQSYGADLGLTYDVTRHVSAIAAYSYYNFKYPGLQFDRNVVTFSISSTWP